ncbi:hypothetical protein [Nocardioides alcanivorans]|uniref:hypothetical protein n=1 Tax=Nocardioides alcanivorans TaxID=2897352 RepID=UPI001F20F532|nr:hypothetical protein [Nocardioides alcanivorans]
MSTIEGLHMAAATHTCCVRLDVNGYYRTFGLPMTRECARPAALSAPRAAEPTIEAVNTSSSVGDDYNVAGLPSSSAGLTCRTLMGRRC